MDAVRQLWNHRHLIAGWTWVLLAVPSMIWWRTSVLFIILLSLYANAEASFAAYHARKANQ